MTSGAFDLNGLDAGVVEEICGYLTSTPRRSFFLFAGAGSGKTRTLVEVLRRLTGVEPHEAGTPFARQLRIRGQSIRVITYTRNAVEVINGRLGDNGLARVSTIHAFCWELIKGFDDDIREALRQVSVKKVDELKKKSLTKKLSAEERRTVEDLPATLARWDSMSEFTYSPATNKPEKGALTHSDVLAASAELLTSRATLRQALSTRHPVILIDESQDTMRGMLDALMLVAADPSTGAALGLLGDHRQRIYTDGHRDLPSAIPGSWATPSLKMNHRSRERIVALINAIWEADLEGRTQPAVGVRQHASTENVGGLVRIFIGDSKVDSDEKVRQESLCANLMALKTGHPGWDRQSRQYQVLALEHKLAARRGGFQDVYDAMVLLDREAAAPQGVGDNKGPPVVRAILQEVAELVSCSDGRGGADEFAVVEVLNRYRRLDDVPSEPAARVARLGELRGAVHRVIAAASSGDCTVREVVSPVVESDLFDVGRQFLAAFGDSRPRPPDPKPRISEDADDRIRRGWHDLLTAPWAQVVRYRNYLQGGARVATHQVVKGSEFDHVMVIMDDEDAGGFRFSYDKLFGAAALTDADRKNVSENEETSIDRTLRLLYVTCSRAKESLALVLWSRDPAAARQRAITSGWFEPDEIETIPP